MVLSQGEVYSVYKAVGLYYAVVILCSNLHRYELELYYLEQIYDFE